MEIFGILKQIAELGIPGLMMSLFVILYLRERSEHNKTRDKYVQAAIATKELFYKVTNTMKIIGDENSVDFEETKHRLDAIEKMLREDVVKVIKEDVITVLKSDDKERG